MVVSGYVPRVGTRLEKGKAMCETYLGWTNRETWALMLWINNDEGLRDMAHEYIAGYTREARLENLTHETSKALREWTESMFTRSGYVETFGDAWPDSLADIAEDIGSLYRINYYECAESILSDMALETVEG
jgi:hypothetical protein